ncbi:orotidine 5'-phosphate decarboxylase [Marasmius tenuissimus]|nr:orotidine 5'-phosphate decarboxylase [Marasmius tenuissimus]
MQIQLQNFFSKRWNASDQTWPLASMSPNPPTFYPSSMQWALRVSRQGKWLLPPFLWNLIFETTSDLKTHIDILEDFDPSIIGKLQELSKKHDFVIFEDRKFADIGNTVALQYSSGVYRIASWSHITNAHPVPGPSIVAGLASVGLPLGRGLLLLAEMSTKGALTVGTYTEEAVRMARDNRDFVIGFIAQRRMEEVGVTTADEGSQSKDDFLILSPGVGLDVKGDGMGQQYRTPREVVLESGCDVIIVGRGVYGKDPSATDAIRAQAIRYKEAGWKAYEERVALNK